jgi:hypothetical protein
MKKSVRAVGAVTLAVIGTAVVGCGGSSTTTSSSSASSKSSSSSSSAASSSTTAAAADYSGVLIVPADIVLPGDSFTADAATPNPGGKDGIATTFTNQAGNRTIGDTIFVLGSASDANGALDTTLSTIGQNVANGQPASASVGSNGTLTQGQSPDGTKEVSVLLFTEGKAFVTMQFESAAGDPVPADFVTAVGQKQDDAIKANLPA